MDSPGVFKGMDSRGPLLYFCKNSKRSVGKNMENYSLKPTPHCDFKTTTFHKAISTATSPRKHFFHFFILIYFFR